MPTTASSGGEGSEALATSVFPGDPQKTHQEALLEPVLFTPHVVPRPNLWMAARPIVSMWFAMVLAAGMLAVCRM